MNLPSEDEEKMEYLAERHINELQGDCEYCQQNEDSFISGYKQGEKQGFLKAIEMLKKVNNNWAKNYLREKMGNEK